MIILQVSKIPDSAFTKCKVKIKNVFHVKKYLQVWIFVCIFVLFKKRILIICFNCFCRPFLLYDSWSYF